MRSFFERITLDKLEEWSAIVDHLGIHSDSLRKQSDRVSSDRWYSRGNGIHVEQPSITIALADRNPFVCPAAPSRILDQINNKDASHQGPLFDNQRAVFCLLLILLKTYS
jgi:hypothetical protein